MFFSLLLALPLLAAPPAPAANPPVLTLKAARAQAAGATVTVRGVVLNGAELGNLRFVQDAGAGLALYASPGKVPGFSELRAGDSIQVTGQLKLYNGLLEMDPISVVQRLAKDRPLRALPAPAGNPAAVFSEAYESRLVEIKGVKALTTADGAPITTFAANTNYLLDGKQTALLRISGSSDGLAGQSPPSGAEPFDVRGIVSQHAPGGSGGYQLLPRTAADFVRGGGRPLLTDVPVPVEVSATSVTLAFATLNPGDTRVRYGLSAQDLKQSRTDAALTTQHRITLDGLISGATYYVEVSSGNAAGTETAPAVPVITAGGKRGRSGH